MGIKQAGHEEEARVIISASEQKRLKPQTPYYCQNPECNQQIDPHKWRFKPKYCDKKCRYRAYEIGRGQCQRPGCKNYVKKKGNIYCSNKCRMDVIFIPRGQCQRPGCTNQVKSAHAIYCSAICRDICIDRKEISKKGRAIIQAHKSITGKIPKQDKISQAVSRNNRKYPPRRKMRREGMIGVYQAIYEPEENQYRGTVPAIPGIIARGRTKREAEKALRQLLREQNINIQKKPIITSSHIQKEGK